MCLKNQIIASKLSQTQLETIVLGARRFIEKCGSYEPIHNLFFDTYFPNTNEVVDFDHRHLNGFEPIYLSVLIHVSVLSFGYGLDISRQIAAEAHALGISAHDLRGTEAAVFDDLISRYVGSTHQEVGIGASFAEAVNSLWESDQELITTFKNYAP